MIKHNELSLIVEDCFEHIRELLKVSKFLYENNKIPSTIFFSVIIIEETGKLAVYSDYLRKFQDIPDDLETKLRTDHLFKLRQIVDLEVERNKILKTTNSSSLVDSNIIPEKLKEKYLKLDKIKQLALYYDYKKGKSFNLYHHFEKHKITKNNLAHFCFILLNLALYYLVLEKIRHKYGTRDGILFSNKIPLEDVDYVNLNGIVEDIRSKKDTSLSKFQITFNELIILYDEIYKK